jgi:hypothetical protein
MQVKLALEAQQAVQRRKQESSGSSTGMSEVSMITNADSRILHAATSSARKPTAQ